MGYIRNHAIIVEASYGTHLQTAHAKAKEIFGEFVSEITPTAVNGSQAFFIPPDGSKEGWDTSDKGDLNRQKFKAWMRTTVYEDGSGALKWAEVMFGDDNGECRIEDHSDLHE